jgi:rod shape-determining protein MreC
MLTFLGRHWRRILLALLLSVVTGIVIFRINRRPVPFSHFTSASFQSVFIPLSQSVQNVLGLPEKLFKNWNELTRARVENERLRNEVEDLRLQLSRMTSVEADNTRLQALLKLKPPMGRQTRLARVVSHDPSTWHATFLIDAGREEGIAPGSPVLTSQGVVGRVSDTFESRSRVLLASAPSSSVAAVDVRSQVRGIVCGTGDQRLKLQYVTALADIQTGDLVVSSGLGGVFPRGLPLGTVVRKVLSPNGLTLDIDLAPAVDFGSVDYVYILEPQDALP